MPGVQQIQQQRVHNKTCMADILETFGAMQENRQLLVLTLTANRNTLVPTYSTCMSIFLAYIVIRLA
jgi:hypothetical protein